MPYQTPNNNVLIIIAGPTGIGKSAIAHALAKKLNTDIFSADSRQVYKELSIGTAAPSERDLKEVRYHFIQNISIHQKYDVGTYVEDCRAALNTYFGEQRIAILIGGTGLYIHALINGIDQFPEVTSSSRDAVATLLEREGIEGLQQFVQHHDPAYYSQVDLANVRRLSRAVEVMLTSGMPYSSFKNETRTRLNAQLIPILLTLDRTELYSRINTRVDTMISQGLWEEAANLYPYKSAKALDTVGYKEIFASMNGQCTREEAIDLIKQNSRRYAKRQITWFNKYGDWQAMSPDYQVVESYALNNISDITTG